LEFCTSIAVKLAELKVTVEAEEPRIVELNTVEYTMVEPRMVALERVQLKIKQPSSCIELIFVPDMIQLGVGSGRKLGVISGGR
jgi:hypothetical protein